LSTNRPRDDDDRCRWRFHVILLDQVTPLARRNAPSLPYPVLGARDITAHAHRRVLVGFVGQHRQLAINDQQHLIRQQVGLQLARVPSPPFLIVPPTLGDAACVARFYRGSAEHVPVGQPPCTSAEPNSGQCGSPCPCSKLKISVTPVGSRTGREREMQPKQLDAHSDGADRQLPGRQ
jgi:hypothetical protein